MAMRIQKNNQKSIYLNGFRATGKTAVGKKLAKKLGWEFIDMDKLIEEKAGMDIDELTVNGTDWQEFRQLEHNVLQELLHQYNLIVSLGGGTLVNNIIKKGTDKTFGKINLDLIKSKENIITVLLTADEKTILDRIIKHELENPGINRPIIDEKHAKEIQEKFKKQNVNTKEKKKIIIRELLKDTIKTYKQRKPLYEKITDIIIDTGKMTIDECADKIINLLNKQ